MKAAERKVCEEKPRRTKPGSTSFPQVSPNDVKRTQEFLKQSTVTTLVKSGLRRNSRVESGAQDSLSSPGVAHPNGLNAYTEGRCSVSTVSLASTILTRESF